MATKKSPQRLAYEREVKDAMKKDKERREKEKRARQYSHVPDVDGRTTPILYDDRQFVVGDN